MMASGANETLVQTEQQVREELYTQAVREESILKQKSILQWLQKGDQNSSYFHRIIKLRQYRN